MDGRIQVNGVERQVAAPPDRTLLHVLREELGIRLRSLPLTPDGVVEDAGGGRPPVTPVGRRRSRSVP